MSKILYKILTELDPYGAKLVAVSKTKPREAIQELYDQGQRIFGENRPQELATKFDQLPKDIQWHMIGHLQTNKVKYIAPFVDFIHSVDSIRLVEEIEKQAAKHDRIIKILLECKIGEEDTKHGLQSYSEVDHFFKSQTLGSANHVDVRGVMGMASFVSDTDQIRREFRALKAFFDYIKTNYLYGKQDFVEISMGMSGDYLIALEEGSTMVRIGSLLFGVRQ